MIPILDEGIGIYAHSQTEVVIKFEFTGELHKHQAIMRTVVDLIGPRQIGAKQISARWSQPMKVLFHKLLLDVLSRQHEMHPQSRFSRGNQASKYNLNSRKEWL